MPKFHEVKMPRHDIIIDHNQLKVPMRHKYQSYIWEAKLINRLCESHQFRLGILTLNIDKEFYPNKPSTRTRFCEVRHRQCNTECNDFQKRQYVITHLPV